MKCGLCVCAPLLGALVLAGGAARAQTLDPALAATRREMIQQALTAQSAGDHRRAYDLARRAAQIQVSASLNALVAQEARALGDLAVALGAAQQCEIDAERNANTLDRDTVLTTCRQLVADLRPRVGRVRLEVPSPAPAGMTVRIAGNALPQAVWGLGYVVTPGSIEVLVEAPDHDPFRRSIAVTAGAEVNLTASLAPRPRATAPRTRTVTVRVSAGTGPWVAIGAGGAALVLGGVFLGLAQGALGDRDAQCDATGCPESARADHDRYVNYTVAGDVALGVGALAVIGGGLWWYFGRRTETRTERVSVAPTVGANGLGLSGTF